VNPLPAREQNARAGGRENVEREYGGFRPWPRAAPPAAYVEPRYADAAWPAWARPAGRAPASPAAVPQPRMHRVRMAHGSQAWAVCRRVCGAVVSSGRGAGGGEPATPAAATEASSFHFVFGSNNAAAAPSRQSSRRRKSCPRATDRGSSTPGLRHRECQTGRQCRRQTPSTPRQPAKAVTTQNGTSSEKNGSCRPTIAEISRASRPVTCSSVVMGMPSDPKATERCWR